MLIYEFKRKSLFASYMEKGDKDVSKGYISHIFLCRAVLSAGPNLNIVI